MHIAYLAVESFVLEPGRRLRWSSQLGLDPHPGEGLDGSVTAPRLQHGLVLRACADVKRHQQAVKGRPVRIRFGGAELSPLL